MYKQLGFAPVSLLTTASGLVQLFQGESMEAEHARWLAGWEQELTSSQWDWFVRWLVARKEFSDWNGWWGAHATGDKLYYSAGRNSAELKNDPVYAGAQVSGNDWTMIQTIANQLKGAKAQYRLTSDYNAVPLPEKISLNSLSQDWRGGVPVTVNSESAPTVSAGMAGILPVAAILLVTFFLSKK